jgi:hypothetical protein
VTRGVGSGGRGTSRGRHDLPEEDTPARVVRVEPADGATGVLRDSPVVVRLSHPADPLSVNSATLRVEDPCGPVAARPFVSPDGLVVLCIPDRPLIAGVPHAVVARGLRDRKNREVAPHESRFVPAELCLSELSVAPSAAAVLKTLTVGS